MSNQPFKILLPAILICACSGVAAENRRETPDADARFREVVQKRGEHAPMDRKSMSGLVLPVESHIRVDPAYVSRHDVVYLTPNFGPYEGFPMGNGDLGGVIWTTDESVQLQINKSNAYDLDEGGKFFLKSLGRVNIRFGTPSFEWLHLDDFEARLSLHDATARYRAKTNFIKTDVEAITCADRNVWMITCRAEMLNEMMDGLNVSVDLDRYGSRMLRRFKGLMQPASTENLGTPRVSVEEKDVVITESFDDIDFAVALRVLGAEVNPRLLNRRRGSIEFRMESQKPVTVLVSAVTSEESSSPLQAAVELLDAVQQENLGEVKAKHAAWWNAFWNRSFVHLEDDYIENLYHIRRYLMAAGSRANYPVIYNAGIWQWNRDVRNWYSLMGWNQLNTYVGLPPQNDCDLLLPHLDLYWRLMPHLEAKALERFGIKDALLMGEPHDVRGWSDSGPGPGGHAWNFTACPHLSRFFLNQYEFTQDPDFLRNYAYPFARKTAQFYLEYLKWDGEKKRYTIHPAKPYECSHPVKFRDTITDLAMIRNLFPRLIKYSTLLDRDADSRDKWQHVLDNLWDPPLTEREGLGTIFAEAYDNKGRPWPEGSNDTYRRFHFSAGSALGFPGDLLDLDDRGTEEFEIMNRFLKMHFDIKNIITHDPIVAARMGNSAELLRFLDNAVKYDQHYPQGLFYNMDPVNNDNKWNFPEYDPGDPDPRLVADYIYDPRATNKYGNRRRAGVQLGMEPHSIQAAAVNEMLIQSHDGKVRVFPAVPADWEAAFILRASGGFMVSASKAKNREPDHVFVRSAFGNEFRMVNPWNEMPEVRKKDGKPVPLETDGNIISFKTDPEASYCILPAGTTPAEVEFGCERNAGPKYKGHASIGKARDFNLTKRLPVVKKKKEKQVGKEQK